VPPFRHQRDAAADHEMGRQPGDVLAGEADAPGARGWVATDRAHQGGFAGTIGADQRDDLVRRHLERDAAQRLDRTIGGGDVLEREERCHAGVSSSPR
jgi:hypothetical protein